MPDPPGAFARLIEPLVAVVGPTGVGKSRYAARLARLFRGEIINGDSRQVYRGLDIGTGKPGPEELAGVHHHLYNLVSPEEDFNLPLFQQLAAQTISEIRARGHLPFLVGGSGQYIWALLEGWSVPAVARNDGLRRQLEELASKEGHVALLDRLRQVDPETAASIDGRNIRRVIRALEVTQQAQSPFSRLKSKNPPPYRVLLVGLTAGREELYSRTDARVDQMIRAGWLVEVKKLLEAGCSPELSSMNSIGYRQLGEVIEGRSDLEEALEKIKTATHRFVRHQYSWFRLKDRRICWFDTATDVLPELRDLLDGFLNGPAA